VRARRLVALLVAFAGSGLLGFAVARAVRILVGG